MTNYLHSAGGLLADGQPWSISLKSVSSLTESGAQTSWDNRITTFWTTSGVAALFSDAVSLTKTATSTASASWKQTTITRATHSDAGTATTQELPSQDALIVTMRSNQATKSGHGRWFLPAPVAAALTIGTGGEVASANVTTIATALTTLFSGLVTDGVQPVILTRGKTRNGAGPFTTQNVVTGDVPNKLGVQRRRGDKVVPTRTTFNL